MIKDTITAPKGFFAAGTACGIKQSGRPDLGLLVCPTGAKAAVVFTTNKITAAPIQISRKHINSAKIYAVVANSGNANACTGQRGVQNAVEMCKQTDKFVVRSLCATGQTRDDRRRTKDEGRSVLVASTGIIGHRLPMEKIAKGIAKAAARLSNSPRAGLDFAKAIMTTDTKVKQAVRRIKIQGKEITMAGTVKGAGMIAPNMATTLCFITTDAAISKPLLARALKVAVNGSLNKLTVDIHQSTNDMAVILASGLAGNRPITSQNPHYKKFAAALWDLCDDLVRQMAVNAEGAMRMFKVIVNNATTRSDAAKAARAVADSPLVKCAVHGCDPNWGRIICAIGSAGVKLNPAKLSCKLGDMTVFKNGVPKKFDAKRAGRIISHTEHTVMVDLGAGNYSDFCYGCDLSAEYVKINADYHT